MCSAKLEDGEALVCCRYSAGSYILMLGESPDVFIGMRPADVRLALKLGPDVEVLVYPQ